MTSFSAAPSSSALSPAAVTADPVSELSPDNATRIAEQNFNEAMRKYEAAQTKVDALQSAAESSGAGVIRRGTVLDAIKNFEQRRARGGASAEDRRKAEEDVDRQKHELELAREAFHKARETRQQVLDELAAKEAKAAEEALLANDASRAKRAYRSLQAALERDAKRRAEFDEASRLAERRTLELEERQARRRKAQLVELADQVREKQSIEAAQRRVRELMEQAKSDASKIGIIRRMQDDMQAQLELQREREAKRQVAHAVTDAEIAAAQREVWHRFDAARH